MELIPDPKVGGGGGGDTGGDFNTALADILDNSVDAEASVVKVTIRLDRNNNPSVMIADNGCGMTRDGLIDGMKYGSSSIVNKDPRRLGKFGLGLKTASTAFCRCLSVVSKANINDPLYMATWDLDKVCNENSWDLDLVEENEIPHLYKQVFQDVVGEAGHGTLVIWSKIDRLVKGKNAKSNIDRMAERFAEYASIIYHRFIDENDSRARNMSIWVNGEKLTPSDPFALAEMRENDETGTITAGAGVDKECTILMEDGSEQEATFHLQAYILPSKENFHSETVKKKTNINNHNMGFYVYRENRIIACGDWLGLKKTDPHDSLFRAEFSFDHSLDAAFKIDVKKSRIELDPDLGEWISKWMGPGLRLAQDRYRKKVDDTISEESPEYHQSADKNIQDKEKTVIQSRIKAVSEVQPDGTQKIEVTNANTPNGPVVVSIRVAPDDVPGVTIKVGKVQYNALWEPSFYDGHRCVLINPDHPFYQKVYYPNLKDGITMTGLDSLLWACVEAEYGIMNELQKKDFEEFRMKVSSILSRLVEDLPEPEV